MVERYFNRLKQFRAVATRFENRAVNYRAMMVIASLLIWLDDDLGPETPDPPEASDRRRRELAAQGVAGGAGPFQTGAVALTRDDR